MNFPPINYYPCTCCTHAISIDPLEPEKDYSDLFINIWYLPYDKSSIINKLKLIINIIMGREYIQEEIILSKENAMKMAKDIINKYK